MTRLRTQRRWQLSLGATAAALGCLAVTVWAVLALIAPSRPGAASDVAASSAGTAVTQLADPAPARAEEDGAPAQPAPTAPASGAVVRAPQVRPAGVDAHQQQRAARQGATPVRVQLPAVGIDSLVTPVGLAAGGQMEIPLDARQAGWYSFGPAPGENGSAVLAGHVDDHLGRPGSLAPLHDVEPGDEVVIEHADGTRTVYLVEARESVPKSELAVDHLFARGGKPRLVLVTCTGAWSTAERRYQENLVVTARPVDR